MNIVSVFSFYKAFQFQCYKAYALYFKTDIGFAEIWLVFVGFTFGGFKVNASF